jgi:hypothetical protein
MWIILGAVDKPSHRHDKRILSFGKAKNFKDLTVLLERSYQSFMKRILSLLPITDFKRQKLG